MLTPHLQSSTTTSIFCFHDSLTIFIPTKLVEEAAVEGANLGLTAFAMVPKSTRVLLFLFIDKIT
jgi:hypothetical protein